MRASPIRLERHKACRTWGSSQSGRSREVSLARKAKTQLCPNEGKSDKSRALPSNAAELANDRPLGVGHGLDGEPGLSDQRHFGQALVRLGLFKRDRSR